MSWPNILYFISIALQVSGALILILFCWGNTEKRVLNTIFPANTSVHREDDDTVIISKDKLFKAHKEILLNRNAFLFIGAGYLLSLFGDNDGICVCMGLIVVLIMSVAFMGIGWLTAYLIAKMSNRNDRIYSYEEFCSKVDNDVVTNYTKAEIEKFLV